MDLLSNLLSSLNLDRPTQNLEFIQFDPTVPNNPFQTHNDLYWFAKATCLTAIMLYAYHFRPAAIRAAITTRLSPTSPEAAEAHLLRYDVEPFQPIKDEHYYFALDYITDKFRPKWLIHPVHFTDLRWYPWKTNTSAERPFTIQPRFKEYLRKKHETDEIPNERLTFANLYTPIFEYCRMFVHNVKTGSALTCPDHITMHSKPSLALETEPDKVRSVWGMPKYFIFIEAMFFWPLFSHYFTIKHTPLLWNYETLNGGWYRLNDEYYSDYSHFKTIFNTDWSEFDMRFYFTIWQDILDKVKTYFCFCGKYCPTSTYPDPKTDPIRIQRLWTWLNTNYFTATCVSPMGRVFRRLFAGMPSGIFCTQYFDSIYNGIMIVCCLHSLGYPIPDDLFLKLMGDDALFGLLQLLPVLEWADFLDALSKEALLRFNARLSSTKSTVSHGINGARVLSYANSNGFATRDPDELLARLLHPKQMRDTPERLMARSIGIYYASCASRKLRPICKHIYDDLHAQGYTPSVSGLFRIYDPLSADLTESDLDRFPTELEVLGRLASPSQRDPEIQARYWNRDHFIFEAGIAQH